MSDFFIHERQILSFLMNADNHELIRNDGAITAGGCCRFKREGGRAEADRRQPAVRRSRGQRKRTGVPGRERLLQTRVFLRREKSSVGDIDALSYGRKSYEWYGPPARTRFLSQAALAQRPSWPEARPCA